MTDKKIIIDVNKCKYRDTYSNFCLAEKDNIGECYTICTGNDCYYKQLQRKEQELKEYNQKLMGALCDIQRKEQECEELKEQLDTAKINYANEIDYSKMYKQALDKIEEIANTHTSVHCLNPDCNCNNCHDEITDYGKTCINKGRLEILSTINEVKND